MTRFSGTEPIVRLYAEAKSRKTLKDILKAGEKLILNVILIHRWILPHAKNCNTNMKDAKGRTLKTRTAWVQKIIILCPSCGADCRKAPSLLGEAVFIFCNCCSYTSLVEEEGKENEKE